MGGKVALVDEYGAFLSVKQGRFQLKVSGAVKWELAPVEVDSIVFLKEGCSLSAAAVTLANEFGVDLVFMKGNSPKARLVTAKYGTTMLTWNKQLEAFKDEQKRTDFSRKFVEGKVHNQRMIIMEYLYKQRAKEMPVRELEEIAFELSRFENEVTKASSAEEAMNTEAHAARSYWLGVSLLLPREIGFSQRLTRLRISNGMAVDGFNIALNIGYAALKKEIWSATFLSALNPYVGFLHKPRAGKMSLVFDLMEEFRPIAVDRPLIAFARKEKEAVIRLSEDKENAFTKVWRQVISTIYANEMALKRKILSQARLLASALRGEAVYKPYKSKW
ncbi:MAG: CRISPR-associated endonuclease Cas1 [Candidatus Bathyarchaeaceae archaeon]